jgi:hypothetical protein
MQFEAHEPKRRHNREFKRGVRIVVNRINYEVQKQEYLTITMLAIFDPTPKRPYIPEKYRKAAESDPGYFIQQVVGGLRNHNLACVPACLGLFNYSIEQILKFTVERCRELVNSTRDDPHVGMWVAMSKDDCLFAAYESWNSHNQIEGRWNAMEERVNIEMGAHRLSKPAKNEVGGFVSELAKAISSSARSIQRRLFD